jgi:ribosomal protein S18 acetylase RimI-like enzyme
MTLEIRQAGEADVPAICTVIDAAYTVQVQRLYGNSRRGRWTAYAPVRVQTSLDREPAGVRVSESQGEIVAVCMSRSYGSLGWFHSLAVHPQHQRRGIGQALVADALAYLGARGAGNIGLMTWPDAIDNISFYLRLGFQPAGLSTFAYRQTIGAVIDGRAPLQARMLSSLTGNEFDLALAAAARLSETALAGLDFSAWLRWLLARKAGDVLLVGRDEHLVALALAQPQADWLDGRLLLIAADATADESAWTVEFIRRWALNHRFGSFSFAVDLISPAVVRFCRDHGMQPYGDSMLNLVSGAWPPAGIHCLRFSG